MDGLMPQANGDDAEAGDVASLQAELAGAHRELREAETLCRAANDRETLLRGELQHRVRNTLAIIRSIFTRTVAAGGTMEDVANHFCGRLDAVARYQPPASVEPGGTVDLETMVREELHSFQFGDQPNIAIAGEDVGLGLDMAQMIGLALHELATNSIKFGALSPEGHGSLHIAWRAAEDMLHFEWRETGVPVLGAAPLRRGFGQQFIEQALPYQINATTLFELRPGGVFCTIVAPIAPAMTRPGLTSEF